MENSLESTKDLEARVGIEPTNKGFADLFPPTLNPNTFGESPNPQSNFAGFLPHDAHANPLAIDLFCGLGGWAEGFLAEGYSVVGFDITRHRYPVRNPGSITPAFQQYPGQLVIQDALTLHGSQFKDAAVIVASPPCQKYSWLAMPWSRSKDPNNSKAAKALRKEWETNGPDNRLFDACFQIQREAIAATAFDCPACFGGGKRGGDSGPYWCARCDGKSYLTRHIPLIVENVRGAQPWVGRSAWNFGSFHLWGDVPALMPINMKRPSNARDQAMEGQKVPGFRFDGSGRSFQTASVETTGQKVPVYSDPRRNGGKGVHLTSPEENLDGTKIGGDWFSDPNSTCRKHGSKSSARKAASAQIAKIPFQLSSHIARVYKPAVAVRGAA